MPGLDSGIEPTGASGAVGAALVLWKGVARCAGDGHKAGKVVVCQATRGAAGHGQESRFQRRATESY